MEDQTAILTGSLQVDLFETQIRGYHRRQVEEHVKRTGEQLADLEVRLSAAVDAADRAHRELAHLQEQYRQVATRPAHEEVSERLSQILRLAAEEAEQERTRAEGDIAELRASTQAEVESLLGGARAEAEQVLGSARAEAESALARAHEEAQQLLQVARSEADRLIIETREHADRLRTQAERRAAAINGVLDQRVEALAAAHGGAVARLAEIRDTLAGLLAAEAGAGSLLDGVSPVAVELNAAEQVAADPEPVSTVADEVADEPPVVIDLTTAGDEAELAHAPAGAEPPAAFGH
ncbi:MAG TPA: hypothetical protein VFP72_03210 [Kineosporiaceae bacterium]|nr:hypothetical protein [Kineosporiaceae bacterium]